ncbi:MAG: hypothetical protein A2309_14170 [Bacteroidetes bacterium RIFOXYB2_FULL_35_7]|nr:MAG: hypothetical protein A2X01_10880 [Bacteroidetes bacterium GWF2_35_48]OFY97379.1 MAG: hypothetical protein A2309_14170 [Bacteroidetes bacterium RIFOXYB2_FULL_35_7]HBX52826.1 hypothetical protein [Bacteroidales bacterium]
MDINETQKIKPKIHDLSAFKQVMESRSHPLDMVREAISNMLAPEVGAREVTLQHYSHPEFNASFIFKDDGIGMTYTGDAEKPGRLDRFIGLAFSKSAGLGGDYWGWKGLGSKLMLNCSKLVIESWTGLSIDMVYKIEIFNPRLSLLSDPPCEPVYELTQRRNNSIDRKGTKIEVFGYDGGKYNYSFEELKRYLYLNTAIGLTKKMDNLPQVNLKVNSQQEILNIGFNFITEQKDSWRTIVIKTPLVKSEKVKNEDGKEVNVEVVLKGGFTLDTGLFGLSPKRYNTGLRLSIKGIPYFQLPLYDYKGNKFNQYKDLCSFIVECDALEPKLNMDRSNISNQHGDDIIVKTFRRLTVKCFDEFAESDDYKNFEQKRKNEDEKSKADAVRERQLALSDKDQEYVCIEEDCEIRVLHRVPNAEHDTLALFWKLESLKILPFEKFITLEHTNQAGIDIIASYQIDEQSTINQFVSIEFEFAFSNFIKHGHNPKQTSMIICWYIDKPKDLQKINEYFFRYNINGLSIPVYEIRSFPVIKIKRYNEIDL